MVYDEIQASVKSKTACGCIAKITSFSFDVTVLALTTQGYARIAHEKAHGIDSMYRALNLLCKPEREIRNLESKEFPTCSEAKAAVLAEANKIALTASNEYNAHPYSESWWSSFMAGKVAEFIDTFVPENKPAQGVNYRKEFCALCGR